MSTWNFATTKEADEFCQRIASEIVRQFGMTFDEAIGGMNRHWAGATFVARDEIDLLTHERAQDWARIMVLGIDVDWWNAEQDLTPIPYP